MLLRDDGGGETVEHTGPFVEILGVSVQDGRYLVEYRVSGLTAT